MLAMFVKHLKLDHWIIFWKSFRVTCLRNLMWVILILEFLICMVTLSISKCFTWFVFFMLKHFICCLRIGYKIIFFLYIFAGTSCWLSKCLEDLHFCFYCILWDQSSGNWTFTFEGACDAFIWCFEYWCQHFNCAVRGQHPKFDPGYSLQNLSWRGLDA